MASSIVSPERDTERRTSKDTPNLSLSLDSPPSSSPFPSPSSSFLPPPMPGPHEFANKLTMPGSKKKLRDSEERPASAVPPAAPTGANGIVNNTYLSSPTTQSPPQTPKTSKRASLAVLSLDTCGGGSAGAGGAEASTPLHAKRASLSSTRRAPPSPSVSRRESGANGNASGNVSVALSRVPSTATRSSSMATAAQRRRSRSIKIRDFAFSSSDLRHTGQGPDAPRVGRSRAPSEGEGSSRRNSGWGAFRWAGSKLWGFGLGGGKRSSSAQADDDGFVPTKSDFERNFDMSSPTGEYPDDDYDDDEGEYVDSQEGEEYPDQDVPLLPGLYRAMYAFVPEGTAEMALAEDQIVRIIGRGGGVGWAIAEDEAGHHALVPESYLEVVELDGSLTDSDY